MKKLFVIGIMCLLLVGCSKATNENNNEKTSSYKTITAKEAYDMMDGDVIILDVRTEAEYEDTHIKGAINIPLDKIDENTLHEVDELESKEVIILVYCASGNRSKQASSKLTKLGYINVYDFGGISSWNYGVVDGKS